MSTNKPSTPEDEYFAREEQEKRTALRQKLDQQRSQAQREHEKREHWMRCPKCGGQLQETPIRGVVADICTRCKGVWLDQGEFELLAGTSETVLQRIVQAFHETMQYGEPISEHPGALPKNDTRRRNRR